MVEVLASTTRDTWLVFVGGSWEFRVWGLGFRVLGGSWEFRVWGLGLRVRGWGFIGFRRVETRAWRAKVSGLESGACDLSPREA